MSGKPDLTPASADWRNPERAAETAALLLGDWTGPIEIGMLRASTRRIGVLRDVMRKSWAGLEDAETGHLTDWLVACCIAREPALLLGPPGCAKSEIAVRLLHLFGLKPPMVDEDSNLGNPESIKETRKSWNAYAKAARGRPSYFHYLLTRFTQPEELFGPVDIDLLRKGILARVNFGLLTGPGIWGAFLDEVFKASASILNTLLTLTHERRYFNWGGMEPADLIIMIGASNEMPGAFGTAGGGGIGGGGEDFQTLYAFVDRFPIRLQVPLVTGEGTDNPLHSDLARAFDIAMSREANRFLRRDGFSGSVRSAELPSINDLLLVGRGCFQNEQTKDSAPRFESRLFHGLKIFREQFLRTGNALQHEATEAGYGQLTWTISPRKLRALFKIALAHALVTDDKFMDRSDVVQLGRSQLGVFRFIWDSPLAIGSLEDRTRALINQYT